MIRRAFLAATALIAVAAPLTVAAAPAHAATTSTSGVPTTSTSNVARGHRIPVYVNDHYSKVLSRTSTLWHNGHKVTDWSPAPGTYKVKSVIRYQVKVYTKTRHWYPDVYCYGDYDENGNWDDNLDCVDDGYWAPMWTTRMGAKHTVTRYNYARVASDETPGCVSHAEFRAVKNGMTRTHVTRMFGTSGSVQSSGSGGTSVEYTTCTGDSDWSYVDVDFDPRVWFKWEYISY